MTDTITILPTLYNGITFRSRTEARWAVMFENMGLAWDYEPEGHGIDGRGYLPDFYLPQLDMWFEVKPEETDGSEVSVFAALCRASDKHGIIAYGAPNPSHDRLRYFGPDRADEGRYRLMEDRRDDGVYWLSNSTRSFSIGGPGDVTAHDRLPCISGRRIVEAYEAARAERFGH